MISMLYGFLADLVLVVHVAFIAFIAVGGLMAWRWPGLLRLHVPALLWGVAIITVGFTCPLTPLEKYFRRRAGARAYDGGFIDNYIEGVVYPESYTPWLRAAAGAAIAAGYVGLLSTRHRRRASAKSDPLTDGRSS